MSRSKLATMAITELRGTRIAYDDIGAGQPAVLLLPGWCAPRWVFRPLLPLISEQRAYCRLIGVVTAIRILHLATSAWVNWWMMPLQCWMLEMSSPQWSLRSRIPAG
jgi:hypothetical protein